MVDPTFVMHWHEEIPKVNLPGAEVIVWAGQIHGAQGLPPPKDSYASQPESDVAVWHLTVKAGGSVELPASSGPDVTRCLYFYEGAKIAIGEDSIQVEQRIELNSNAKALISNPSDKDAQILVLQGRPLGEPVVKHGPFVMNTQQEITQAFQDYQRTQFGGWPWPQDAMVFPREKGRFALLGGKELLPPSAAVKSEL